jgi:UDP-glucuronate 4-epimerase
MAKTLKILITGAAGFIGFHTALALKDHSVIGYDNFDPYYSVDLKKARTAILKEAGISVITGDLNDRKRLFDLMEQERFTHIIHLAAQAGVRHSLKVPEDYVRANIDGFLSILELARSYPETKVVYASSSSVYGLNTKMPYSVADPTDHQASFYGVTKKTNELMAASYHHLFDLDLVGLRFFTVYGPWGRPDMAYYTFSKAIVEGRPIDLYNYGNCKRDFTYVDDIVEGIKGALNLSRGNTIFNLGNNQPVTLLHFVETLETLLGKKTEKILLPLNPGDVPATWADISLSQEKLHFHPKTSLQEGLSHFVDWFKKHPY